MFRAVIFDVDGTLVDSVDLTTQAWQDAFRAYGHEIGFEDIRGQIGKSGDQLMPMFLGLEELDAMGEQLEQHRTRVFQERYLPQVEALPQVRALFERLRANGMRIVLASSGKGEDLETYKRAAGIEGLVEGQTTTDEAGQSKPYSDIFLAALERLRDVALEDVLAVGAAPYDAEAAGKAGLRIVGLLCAGFAEDDLRDAGCIAIYRDPADLLAQYDRSPLAQRAAA